MFFFHIFLFLMTESNNLVHDSSFPKCTPRLKSAVEFYIYRLDLLISEYTCTPIRLKVIELLAIAILKTLLRIVLTLQFSLRIK